MQEDYSMCHQAIQLGGHMGRVVDMGTGEIVYSSGRVPAPPSAGGARPGLSSAHIRPETGEVSFWKGGGLVSAKKHIAAMPQKGGGPRGKIVRFSRGARTRLMRKLSQTKKSEIPVMVTLTYPGDYTHNSRVWKRDLSTFWKRVKRKFPLAGCFWKLEPQKRGAPHYHMLIWGVDYLDLLCFVSRAWYQVVGSGDERHLKAGTRVEEIRSWRGVMSYASKYLGKTFDTLSEDVEGWDEPGRFWGVLGREFIPWAELVTIETSFGAVCKIMRLMRRAAHIRGRDYPSLTGFFDGEFWLSRFGLCVV